MEVINASFDTALVQFDLRSGAQLRSLKAPRTRAAHHALALLPAQHPLADSPILTCHTSKALMRTHMPPRAAPIREAPAPEQMLALAVR